ncbi:type VI secretion system protein ImpM [Methylobacterium sp. BE186]|uniref:type VI secretion system-associated protein TagF n=1 Tax=Methylobacterium sp. BE186 TaxID=2817715 RepID=UPI00285D5972|nr:type VI secretion system-associated protein TagF [Methylobacterium sp. BE186]MDR7040144.1 type VI secretion system protein ImpM [Methylobacterium sp. BE186]
MRCGLYGKLPAKRDFIAPGASREFLATVEPWLQQGVAASRASLGAEWQPAFLRAPIWRFWLGHEVCGATTLGALMPSVDGVGRYFPLAAFACAEADEHWVPPDIDPQDAWMGAVEDILLSALAPGTGLESVSEALKALGRPAAAPPPALPEGIAEWPRAALPGPLAEGDARGAFAALRAAGIARSSAGATYWWTLGGEEVAPRALASRGLPDPACFAAMLTGSFGRVSRA